MLEKIAQGVPKQADRFAGPLIWNWDKGRLQKEEMECEIMMQKCHLSYQKQRTNLGG